LVLRAVDIPHNTAVQRGLTKRGFGIDRIASRRVRREDRARLAALHDVMAVPESRCTAVPDSPIRSPISLGDRGEKA